MRNHKGFSLIEIIVAIAIMAILSTAVVPAVINKLQQARYQKLETDLEAIYTATMGKPQENYFGFVGDVGKLPDSVAQLLKGTGLGSNWNGPYLSSGGALTLKDVYGHAYVIDTLPIQVRSYGPDGANNHGGGDDIVYPANPTSTYKGALDVQVYINGRIIDDATTQQVTATLTTSNNGTPALLYLNFNTSDMVFRVDSVHQGIHTLTVNANKSVRDGTHTQTQLVSIYAGSKTTAKADLSDNDYFTRTDTDLNGNGIPDRLEDMDGDGIPNSMDPDIDGDGTPNAIDPDSLNPLVKGAGGAGTAPMISALTPSYGHQGDTNLLITIDGSYFASGAKVVFSGTGVTVLDTVAIFNGATQLQVHITIGGSAATGYRTVTVTNLSGLSGSGSNIFQVLTPAGSPAPQISQVNPNAVLQGVTGTVITITGQNFQSTSTVTFSNPGVTVSSKSFVSSSQINATINVSGSASTGAGTVKITNPDAQYATSAFTIQAVVPNIASISPNNASSGASNVLVTMSGSNFVSGFSATSSGSPLSIASPTFVSSTSITIRVSVSFALQSSDRNIYITNPGGGADTVSFHINGLF